MTKRTKVQRIGEIERMMKELPKVYEPQQVESRIYQMWEDNDCFNGDPDP